LLKECRVRVKLFFKKFSNYQQNSKCGKDLEIFGIKNLEYQDLHREEILHWQINRLY
jgi:hypothetical protein